MRNPFRFRHGRRHEAGQALVVVVIGLGVILAGTAMVIDGGNAMAQQRQTQNATDAAALAGALTIAQDMGGESKDDGDVRAAMLEAFDNNDAAMGTSYYIDYNKNVVGTVGGGSMPSDAAGVQAAGNRTFNTFLAGMLGISTMTAGASATAMAGSLRSVCAAADGCGVVPVTFSIPITACDGTNRPLRIGEDWPLVSEQVALDDWNTGRYMSIVPLCRTGFVDEDGELQSGPGGVGWLDMGCGGNLEDEIENACNGPFDVPSWLHTATGNVNAVESAFDQYVGEQMLVPMFDATCRDIPTTGLPADCTDPGDGDNLYYHIPRFADFLLYEAHIIGNNYDECNSPPGQPILEGGSGNGATSCFKGWFVRYIMQGKVGRWEDCDASVMTECIEPLLGVQLVR